jgi:hypothetical protein
MTLKPGISLGGIMLIVYKRLKIFRGKGERK